MKELIIKTVVVVVVAVITVLMIKIALLFFLANSVKALPEEEQYLKSEFRSH